ncbi:hypothetical protein VP01_3377g1 [Puccinia sorghi]|uniref:Uncharacterized protein n=1 Tax=Puccinia sorghi TaxID=27349 RepID=A0A0L6UXP7_9BASI|nr:hypothetical protein VP01_3377g1 [Puccinia sorghi]
MPLSLLMDFTPSVGTRHCDTSVKPSRHSSWCSFYTTIISLSFHHHSLKTYSLAHHLINLNYQLSSSDLPPLTELSTFQLNSNSNSLLDQSCVIFFIFFVEGKCIHTHCSWQCWTQVKTPYQLKPPYSYFPIDKLLEFDCFAPRSCFMPVSLKSYCSICNHNLTSSLPLPFLEHFSPQNHKKKHLLRFFLFPPFCFTGLKVQHKPYHLKASAHSCVILPFLCVLIFSHFFSLSPLLHLNGNSSPLKSHSDILSFSSYFFVSKYFFLSFWFCFYSEIYRLKEQLNQDDVLISSENDDLDAAHLCDCLPGYVTQTCLATIAWVVGPFYPRSHPYRIEDFQLDLKMLNDTDSNPQVFIFQNRHQNRSLSLAPPATLTWLPQIIRCHPLSPPSGKRFTLAHPQTDRNHTSHTFPGHVYYYSTAAWGQRFYLQTPDVSSHLCFIPAVQGLVHEAWFSFDIQKIPGCYSLRQSHCEYCTVIVPIHLPMHTGGVWMTAWLENAACQLQEWCGKKNPESDKMLVLLCCFQVLFGFFCGNPKHTLSNFSNSSKKLPFTTSCLFQPRKRF